MRQSTDLVRTHGNGHTPGEHTEEDRSHLSPEMSFCAAGHIVLQLQFDRLVANEAETLGEDNPEALHDMRVATRRLHAALRDFSPAYGREALQPLVADVQWLGNLLGRIRDLDVFIDWLRAYEQDVQLDEVAYVRRVIQDRQQARVREREELLTGLNSARYREFKRVFSESLLSERVPCDADPLVDLAASKIESQLRRVRRRGRRANAHHLKRLHALRIECKRLRYTAEFFRDLFPDPLEKLIRRAQEMQEVLGDIHDAHLHAQFLREMRRTLRSDRGMTKTLDKMMAALRFEQNMSYKHYRQQYPRLGSKRVQRRLGKRLDRAKHGLR